MRLDQLKTGNKFESFSGVKFEVIPFTTDDIRKGKNKDRIRAKRLDTKEEFLLTNMTIIKTEN